MRPYALIIVLVAGLIACDRVKQTAKETIHKTGETVGNTTSEFVESVSEGIDKTYQCEVVLSGDLLQKGLKTGRFSIESTDTSKNNILTAYVIFDKDFHHELFVKVVDKKGMEYGRARQTVSGHQGEAKYVDFVFDKRTVLEGKSKFIVE